MQAIWKKVSECVTIQQPSFPEMKMVVASTVPCRIAEKAEQYIADNELHEPFQRLLAEIPRQLPSVQAIDVVMDYLVDEEGRPGVLIYVTYDLSADNSGEATRRLIQWEIENFTPQNLEQIIVLPVDAHAG